MGSAIKHRAGHARPMAAAALSADLLLQVVVGGCSTPASTAPASRAGTHPSIQRLCGPGPAQPSPKQHLQEGLVRRRAASRSSLVTPVTLRTCFTSARKAAWFLPGDLQQRTQQGRVGKGMDASSVLMLPGTDWRPLCCQRCGRRAAPACSAPKPVAAPPPPPPLTGH